eukprot:20835-Heterococcus_DN1.PRE.2
MVPFQNVKLSSRNRRLCAHNEIGSVLLQEASLHLVRVDCRSPRLLACCTPSAKHLIPDCICAGTAYTQVRHLAAAFQPAEAHISCFICAIQG